MFIRARNFSTSISSILNEIGLYKARNNVPTKFHSNKDDIETEFQLRNLKQIEKLEIRKITKSKCVVQVIKD